MALALAQREDDSVALGEAVWDVDRQSVGVPERDCVALRVIVGLLLKDGLAELESEPVMVGEKLTEAVGEREKDDDAVDEGHREGDGVALGDAVWEEERHSVGVPERDCVALRVMEGLFEMVGVAELESEPLVVPE